MPATLNGIGTTYYGKKNLQKYVGVCEGCGQTVELLEYETRLWFVVVFIPILPLGKKKILDYCPRCSRHNVIDWKEWEKLSRESIEQSVTSAKTKPDDPQAAIELLSTLEAFGQRQEAAEQAERMARRFAENADVLLHLGNWYDSVNLRDESKAAYKKALQLEPDNPLARKVAAIDAIEQGDLSQARQLLRFMETPAPPGEGHDPVVLLMLADAYQQRQEHDSALEVLQTALTIEPNLRNDKEFRKTVRKSEKFNLTRQPLLPPRSIFKSRKFYLAAGLATVIAVFLGVNYYISTHRTLNIVNGLGRVVRVTVQGHDELRVPSGGRVELTVREGSHQAVLVSADGREKEVKFTIESGFWSRYFDDPVYILNAFGATPILWEERFYAVQYLGTPQKEGRARVHLGRDFVSFDDIDHPFEELPGEIEMSESEQETSRTNVSVIKQPPSAIVVSLTTQEIVSKNDLMQYAETHLRANPQDKPLLLAYYGLIYANQETARCRKFLAEGLDKKPIRIDWHRYYEGLCDTTDQTKKLKQRYDRMLGEDPNNSVLLYLAGRLPPRCSEAMKYITRSIAADPKNPYPHMAKAYYLMSRGQFDQAKLAALTAHQLDPENDEMMPTLLGAHFAMKEYSEFRKQIDRLSIAKPADFTLHCGRLAALTASGDIEAIRRTREEYKRLIHSLSPQQAPHVEILGQLYLKGIQGDFDEVLRLAGNLKDRKLAAVHASRACLQSGRIAEAQNWFQNSPMLKAWQIDLLFAVAWRHKGNNEKASTWLARAKKSMSGSSPEGKFVSALLDQGTNADCELAEDLVFAPWEKSLVLIALVQNGADAKMLGLAEKLNFDIGFPHFLLRDVITKLKKENN